jgi:hypothetical protein
MAGIMRSQDVAGQVYVLTAAILSLHLLNHYSASTPKNIQLMAILILVGPK